MRTAEPGFRQLERPTAPPRVPARTSASRLAIPAALAALLAGALALRLWGIGHGLPYAYNIDEADQFVIRAVRMSGTALNPHYFANPPALTYLLHAVFTLFYGGHAATVRQFTRHPAAIYELARIVVALLDVAAIWLQFLLTRRLFGAAAGLLAAAIMAVAFLPVFYSHLALNDAATLLPLTLCLYAAAGIMQRARSSDWLLAGIGLGLGAATKYTAGIAIVAILCAAAIQRFGRPASSHGAGGRHEAQPARSFGGNAATLSGLAICAIVAALCFVLANPYALLDGHAFFRELGQESSVAAEAAGKLGAPKQPAILYYLWSFTWGFGWLPALAALGGIVLACLRERRAALLLGPMALIYLAVMGAQGRAFGRWLMPLLPAASALAAWFALWLAGRVLSRLRGPAGEQPRTGLSGRLTAAALTAVLTLLLVGQGLLYDVHSGLVLSRADTRTQMRDWMLAGVPPGAKIVVEPGVVEAAWLRQSPAPGPESQVPNRWQNYPYTKWLIAPGPDGRFSFSHYYPREEQYARTLTPQLLDYYQRYGYCWVLSASTQYERAFSDPRAVPGAIAYYRRLHSLATAVHSLSPYAPGAGRVSFSYDFSFDYYPLAYRRPGPELTLYRLHGGVCATPMPGS